jgi:tetratricopeptide (TPR) repeat protein
VVPDEPEMPSPDSAEPAEENGSAPGPRKLPAGWQPERAGAKAHQPVFVEEPDPTRNPSPFDDIRYGTFRKQVAFMASVAILAASLLLALYLFFPPPEQLPEEAPRPQSTPSLSAAELRQLEIDRLRGQLQVALANRDWPEIERRAHELLQTQPGDGEAWHALGWIFEKNRAYEEAAQAYGKAADGDFLRPQTLLKRASMRRLQSRYAEALPDLEESARLDPDSVVTPNLLMICKIQAGKSAEVRAEVQNFERVGIVANSDRYLLGKAALELEDGNTKAAAQTLAEFRDQIAGPLYAVLTQDAFFNPYRSDPTLQSFLVIP